MQRHRARVSGPLLDRIDLHVEVPQVPLTVLGENAARSETTATVHERVLVARTRQLHRQGKSNNLLGAGELARHGRLEPQQQKLLNAAIERLALSARARDRVLKVARTIADLADAERIATAHLTEAIGY